MKHFRINIGLVSISILASTSVLAKSPDEVIEGKKRAVLVITLWERATGKPSIGGGFFTDSKGHFITNLHVIEPYLKKRENYQIQIQNKKGEEFVDIEIEKCGSENKIDLCYGKILTDKKIYFFDVVNKSPSKTLGVALIGHNGEYFSVKKGEVVQVETNVEDKFGVPLVDQENRNTSMVQLGKYEYKSGTCKGDSGCPVFDYITGDLAGVFTNCIGKAGQTKNIYSIDSKEVYSFIYTDSKFTKFKIPIDHIYARPKLTIKKTKETSPGKGDEFEFERRTGELE